MKKLYFVVASIAAYVALLFFLGQDEKGTISHKAGPMVSPEEKIDPDKSANLDPAATLQVESSRTPVASNEPASPSSPQSETIAKESETFGSVQGLIASAGGLVLPKHRLVFAAGEEMINSRGIEAKSDDEGFYQIEKIPTGTWTVFYVGGISDSRDSGLRIGQVEIWENQTAVFDAFLNGDRSIKGAFTCKDEPMVGFKLELRAPWDKNQVVASGEAMPLPEEEFAAKDLESEDGDPGELIGEVSGGFQFTGLLPGPYILRVSLGRDTNTGKELYIEREIDLFLSNAELAPEALTLREFVVASAKR